MPGGSASSDDVATIDAAGTYTVTVANSTGNTVSPTYIGVATMNAISATLLISTPLVVKTSLNLVNGTLSLRGGSIRGGTLNLIGGRVDPVGYLGGGTLDGVRVVGALELSSNSSVTLTNNTVFLARDGVSAGLIRLVGGTLTFADNATFDNASIINSYNFGQVNIGTGAVATSLTFGPTAVLSVPAGYALILGGKGTLTNGGTIAVGGTLTVADTVSLATASTPGNLTVALGGNLVFGTSGIQTTLGGLSGAQIQGALTVNGNITTAALGSGLAGANITGTVNLAGIVDNTAPGSVLEFKAGTPLSNVNLSGGTIQGGTLKLTSGTFEVRPTLFYTTPLAGTLDGVRVLGNLNFGSSLSPNHILALKNGVTFAGVGGTGRGSITVVGGEVRALDSEALDHVTLSVSAYSSSNFVAGLLTTPVGGALSLGADTTLTTGTGVTIGGGGTLSYGGAFNVTGSTVVGSGTTLVKAAGGALTVSPFATLMVNWAGIAAPLAGIAGAVVSGSIGLGGTLTTAEYVSALGTLTGTGNILSSGLLDNTGSTLTLAGNTVAGRLNLGASSVLKGGTVVAGATGLSLQGGATLDGVTLRGPTTLTSSTPFFSPISFRNGLSLLGEGGSGVGALTLAGQSLVSLDTTTLSNAAIKLTGTAGLSAATGQRLTLGAGLSVNVNGTATFSNVGSAGAITVEGNSTLNVDSTFTSTGSFNLQFGSKLNVTGTITTASLAGLIASTSGPGVVGLGSNSTLDNTGATLTLLPTGRLSAVAAFGTAVKGGTIVASGGTLALSGPARLDGVIWQGAFAPTTSASYTFVNGTAVQGTGGGRALIDLAGSNSSLSLTEAIDNTDIKLGTGTLSSGAAPVVLGSGATLAIGGTAAAPRATVSGLSNNGAVTQTGGSAVFGAASNTGTMTLSGGTSFFASLANTGTINLTGETVTISTPTVLGGTIAFLDPTSRIVFQGAGAVGANLRGFQNGDSIDIQGLAYGSNLSVGLQGSSLSILQGSVLVASFQLSGGGTAYSADEFSLVSNGTSGTLLKTSHRLSAPVFSGPGTDFDTAFYLARNPDVAAAGVDPLQHYLNNGWKEGRDPNAYFSNTYYLNQNPDVAAAGLNPLAHYAASGWTEGRDPGVTFSTSAYLSANPDVKAAGIDPLQHFLVNGRAEGRKALSATPKAVGTQDPLVDRMYYLAQHPDVAASGEDASANYHRIGWKLGYNPDQFFDTNYYLATNRDVAAVGMDPLAHFENSGYREGREPSLAFSDARYLTAYADVKAAGMNPLLHYLTFGRFEGRMAFINGPQQSGTPDPLVDRAYYYAQFATIVPASADATASYDQTGWKNGYNPNAFFDTKYYLANNTDVRGAGINPLAHYEASGWKEGRNPSAAFSTSKYLAAYSDVRGGNVDPLTSFLTTGQAQGRMAFAV